jgi:hypothetical protein
MTVEQVSRFEKLLAQLEGLHAEIGARAKKAPNDAVNVFKLRFVNATLAEANAAFGAGYRPFADFEAFDSDALPTNSDVSMIVAQYIECAEKLRADNVCSDSYGNWRWRVNGKQEPIRTAPPKKLGGR